jgi:N-acetyl-1-D-myo-inositol-2-amino-2-deoxy-alpha-D-glucopyranoside deacetylase
VAAVTIRFGDVNAPAMAGAWLEGAATMSPIPRKRSLLLVHAHPDDESIFTGATMAKYAAEGARVTLVTCTMGEAGMNRLTRSFPPGRGGMAQHRSTDMAQHRRTDIAEHRRTETEERWHIEITKRRRKEMAEIRGRELEAACAALGVADHRFLGGPGRWRDSGPMGGTDPHSFSGADVEEAAHDLAAVIREVRPQAVVTYDANGFYGHPDHVQAHRVAWRAYQLACDCELTKFYATTMPRSVLEAAVRRPAGGAVGPGPGQARPRMGSSDEEVTTEIDAAAFLNAKLAALRSHATQISVNEPFFHAAGLVEMRALGTEYYIRLAGPSGIVPDGGGHFREGDLFSGWSCVN